MINSFFFFNFFVQNPMMSWLTVSWDTQFKKSSLDNTFSHLFFSSHFSIVHPSLFDTKLEKVCLILLSSLHSHFWHGLEQYSFIPHTFLTWIKLTRIPPINGIHHSQYIIYRIYQFLQHPLSSTNKQNYLFTEHENWFFVKKKYTSNKHFSGSIILENFTQRCYKKAMIYNEIYQFL